MRLRGVVAATGLLLVATGLAPLVGAQETGSEEEPLQAGAPADESAEPLQPVETGEEEEQRKKEPWPLYFEVAVGQADADDINNSVATLSTHIARNLLTLEEQLYGRTAIGWKMPRGKGDFRLVWTGYSEDGYSLSSSGDLAALDPNLDPNDVPQGTPVQDPLPWWNIELVDGQLSGHKLRPQWGQADDTLDGVFTDGFGNARTILPDNDAADCPQYQLALPATPGTLLDAGAACEASFLVERTFSRQMASDMQNRAQTVDLIYGREFGKSRYTAHWWVGARYFVYEGNVPTPVWLSRRSTGGGFSDGAALAMINFSQDTSGFGPNLQMRVFFNFFDKRLSLFMGGQSALMLYNIEVSSQNFFTQVQTSLPSTFNVAAELNEDRDKTSWQNSIEGGIRYSFRNGLQLELAYNFTGFLDVILLPTAIAIPISQSTTQGVSAIYGTQDYRLSAWRGGVAFQF